MRLKLDENLSVELASHLSAAGHDAETCIGEGIAGSRDPLVAQHAFGENRILITLDLDFADMRKYPPGTHPGIIVLRLQRQDVTSCSLALDRALSQVSEEDFQGNLIVVEETRVRIRRPEAP